MRSKFSTVFGTSTALAAALTLAACGPNGTIKLDLTTIKGQSATVDTALDTIAPALILILPPAEQLIATAALKGVDVANSALQALPASGNAATYLQAEETNAQTLINDLKVPSATKVALEASLSIFTAYLNGAVAVAAPAVAAPETGSNVGAKAVVPGPIVSIPLS